MHKQIIIIGGGASGVFAAIAAAESAGGGLTVRIIEADRQCLKKVGVSGGGRCNLTHSCPTIRDFCSHYPRGERELRGPMHAFGPRETVRWFENRGVPLKTEDDGRVFPAGNRAEDVTACLLHAAREIGVNICISSPVAAIEKMSDGRFAVSTKKSNRFAADAVLLAPGGGHSAAYDLAAALGHTIVKPVPSLFAVNLSESPFADLAGITVPACELSLPKFGTSARGTLLVTHKGISGPAVLSLSSLAARELAADRYRARLLANFGPAGGISEIIESFRKQTAEHGRQKIHKRPLFGLPSRLWQLFSGLAGVPDSQTWSHLTAERRDAFAAIICSCELDTCGRNPNREEMVTCGGVELTEVNFRTMESRCCPGLYLAGEVLDIDGFTGGYNLQAAWTTGYIAGKSMGERQQLQ